MMMDSNIAIEYSGFKKRGQNRNVNVPITASWVIDSSTRAEGSL
jgi:hypothetical protein